MFQFKSFALGQTRFLKDAVLAEAANGNLIPLATFLSISPITGELVADAKALIKGKDRGSDGIVRLLENLSSVGGFGLFTDGLSAARWGDLEGFMLGPTFGDFFGYSEFMLQGNTQGILNKGMKTPAFTVTRALLGGAWMTGDAITDYVDGLGESSFEEPDDFQSLIFDRIQQKSNR